MQAQHKLSDKSLVESAAFAATLARRLARMLAAGIVSPAHQLWNLAVDQVLIKAVDADTQARSLPSRLAVWCGGAFRKPATPLLHPSVAFTGVLLPELVVGRLNRPRATEG